MIEKDSIIQKAIQIAQNAERNSIWLAEDSIWNLEKNKEKLLNLEQSVSALLKGPSEAGPLPFVTKMDLMQLEETVNKRV